MKAHQQTTTSSSPQTTPPVNESSGQDNSAAQAEVAAINQEVATLTPLLDFAAAREGVQNPIKIREEINKLTAKYLESPSEDLLANIKAQFAKLGPAMAAARGDDGHLQAYRLKLEDQIGFAAANHADTTTVLDGMCNQAIRMLTASISPQLAMEQDMKKVLEGMGQNEEIKELVASLGVDKDGGYAGAVGKAYNDVLAVLTGGNTRERLTHLVNFGGWFAKEALLKKDEATYQNLLDAGNIAQENVQRIDSIRGSEHGAAGHNAHKTLYSHDLNEDVNQAYAKAKHSEMDAKLPHVPLEALTDDELGVKARKFNLAIPPVFDASSRAQLIKDIEVAQGKDTSHGADTQGTSGGGESNPLSRSTRQREGTLVDLSSRESEGMGLTDQVLPFLEGYKANIVDAENYWIKEAREELQMPLKAGISGTTFRFMHQASIMGADMVASRTAILGHLIPMNAHSLHEICSAASTYTEYTPGSYAPLLPWNEADMAGMARSAGVPEIEIPGVINAHTAPSIG